MLEWRDDTLVAKPRRGFPTVSHSMLRADVHRTDQMLHCGPDCRFKLTPGPESPRPVDGVTAINRFREAATG